MQSKTQKPIHIQRTSDKRVQQPNKFFVNKNDNTPIIGHNFQFSRNQITPRRKMPYVSRKTQTCLQCGEDNTRKLRLLRWPFRNPDTVALCSKTPATLVACFTVNNDVPAKEASNSPPAARLKKASQLRQGKNYASAHKSSNQKPQLRFFTKHPAVKPLPKLINRAKEQQALIRPAGEACLERASYESIKAERVPGRHMLSTNYQPSQIC